MMELKGQKKHETDSGGPSQHEEEKYMIAVQAMQKPYSRFYCFELQVVSRSSAGQQQAVFSCKCPFTSSKRPTDVEGKIKQRTTWFSWLQTSGCSLPLPRPSRSQGQKMRGEKLKARCLKMASRRCEGATRSDGGIHGRWNRADWRRS